MKICLINNTAEFIYIMVSKAAISILSSRLVGWWVQTKKETHRFIWYNCFTQDFPCALCIVQEDSFTIVTDTFSTEWTTLLSVHTCSFARNTFISLRSNKNEINWSMAEKWYNERIPYSTRDGFWLDATQFIILPTAEYARNFRNREFLIIIWVHSLTHGKPATKSKRIYKLRYRHDQQFQSPENRKTKWTKRKKEKKVMMKNHNDWNVHHVSMRRSF